VLVHYLGDQVDLGTGDIVGIVAAETLSRVRESKLALSGGQRENFGSPARPELIDGVNFSRMDDLGKDILGNTGLETRVTQKLGEKSVSRLHDHAGKNWSIPQT
jgi:hypothetical protein